VTFGTEMSYICGYFWIAVMSRSGNTIADELLHETSSLWVAIAAAAAAAPVEDFELQHLLQHQFYGGN
jgi:hypothetical protein